MPATRKRQPKSAHTPDPDAPTPRELRLDAADHVAWAKSRARGVRADFGFLEGSAEEEELESVALAALVRLIDRFDESRLPPGGDLAKAFRGASSTAIRSECRRAGEQLRNGGTYRTKQGGYLVVGGLPVNADGEEEVTDPVSLEEDDHDGSLIAEPAVFAKARTGTGPNAVAQPGDTRARFAALLAQLRG